MSATTQSKRLSAEDRRLLIVRAAGRLFARDGYAGTRLDDIAAAADVTKPVVYKHFESKKALYLALLARHRDDLPSFFRNVEGPSAARSPEIVVREILEHWLDYVRENQHAWVMLFRDSSGDAEIQAFRRQVNLRARQVIARFIAAQPRPGLPAAQVEPTAELLTTGLAGLALWWIDHPHTPKHVLVDVAARASAAAFGAPRQQAAG